MISVVLKQVFDLILAIYAPIVTIIFGLALRKRRDLLYWLFSAIFISIGTMVYYFRWWDTTFEVIGYVFYTIASIFIVSAVYIEYFDTFKKEIGQDESNIDTGDLLLSITPYTLVIVSLQLCLMVLLVVGMIMSLRIYKKKKTPTHLFLFVTVIFAWSSTQSDFLFNFGLFGMSELSYVSNFCLYTVLMSTAFVALIEDRLVKSEKKYREVFNRADFYKDLFVHDINNFLQSLEFSLEIFQNYLKEPQKVEKFQELIKLLKGEVARATSLTLSVKKLYEIDTGTVEIIPTDLCMALQGAIINTKTTHPAEKINIKVKSSQSKYTVQANDLLFIVFTSIISNAIKYNDNTEKVIIISIEPEEKDDKKYIRLEFIDNGIGIPDKIKNSIFMRIYEKPKDYYRIGMGLIFVREVIESFHGYIWVEDKVKGDYKKGSKFIMMIPQSL